MQKPFFDVKKKSDLIESSAVFSPCRKWRYLLTRCWDATKKPVAFLCLNPSTADETKDDNTVRRCINYAKSWGKGKLYVLNIFAYRSTYPEDLYKVDDPIGKDNDFWIEKIAKEVDYVVGAWGNHGLYKDRYKRIIELVQNLAVLEVTKIGQPAHPLYLKKDLKPIDYRYA